MAPEILTRLIGRVPSMCQPAFLPNYTRHPIKGRSYPGIITSKSDTVEENDTAENAPIGVQGILLTGITAEEADIFDAYEADEYKKFTKTILLPSGTIGDSGHTDTMDANVYVWCAGDHQLDLTCDWDYDRFRQVDLDTYFDRD